MPPGPFSPGDEPEIEVVFENTGNQVIDSLVVTLDHPITEPTLVCPTEVLTDTSDIGAFFQIPPPPPGVTQVNVDFSWKRNGVVFDPGGSLPYFYNGTGLIYHSHDLSNDQRANWLNLFAGQAGTFTMCFKYWYNGDTNQIVNVDTNCEVEFDFR
jgi:hypothetical protein